MAASRSDDDVVIIKKYANRRLYDTESSSYITLERLAEMVRQKREFKVVDAKTGEDITRGVLTQIIMDEESRGATMLPVNFLRQLISMYGDQMQSVVPQYLEASLERSSATRASSARRWPAPSPPTPSPRSRGATWRCSPPPRPAAARPRRARQAAPARGQQGRAGRAQGPARRAAAASSTGSAN